MTRLELIAQNTARAIFTTSDKGAVILHNYHSQRSYEEEVLRNYIYLKAFLAEVKLHSFFENPKEYKQVIELVHQQLKKAFSQMPKSLTYGCSTTGMAFAIQQYYKNVDMTDIMSVENAFYEQVNLPPQIRLNAYVGYNFLNVIQEASAFLDNAIIAGCQGQKTGGGCLSTIACMVAIALGLMALVI